jgi:hypothetical protein
MIGKLIRASLVVAIIAIMCPSVLAQDFSGVWSCDDGGTYYIHQIGNNIWWFGENDPSSPGFANVAKGAINGGKISLTWADVPKGTTNNNGILVLSVISEDELQKIQFTGGFGGSKWTR